MTLERVFTNTLTTPGRTCTLTVGVLTQKVIQRIPAVWTNMRGETRNFFPWSPLGTKGVEHWRARVTQKI
jgi:hypothetical protein